MQVDPRSTRFSAAVTTVILALVLLTGNAWLLLVQGLLFALGLAGVSPYGLVFRRLVRPRLGPPAEMEDAAPPRFAQGVGLVFALAALAGFAAQAPALALGATAAALLAAFLNAAFGFCLGCEMYLIIRRLMPAATR
ncbi:DUF4395 domain-containing protein [Sphaerisporangium rhizosphaerae]|uniref:DUF4395 domain-containing protein n=1 Tax=Sphaerisporangium rhizosphaerae TaxID=2269375 RepID=A0ABW2NZN5_9ACTN